MCEMLWQRHRMVLTISGLVDEIEKKAKLGKHRSEMSPATGLLLMLPKAKSAQCMFATSTIPATLKQPFFNSRKERISNGVKVVVKINLCGD